MILINVDLLQRRSECSGPISSIFTPDLIIICIIIIFVNFRAHRQTGGRTWLDRLQIPSSGFRSKRSRVHKQLGIFISNYKEKRHTVGFGPQKSEINSGKNSIALKFRSSTYISPSMFGMKNGTYRFMFRQGPHIVFLPDCRYFECFDHKFKANRVKLDIQSSESI